MSTATMLLKKSASALTEDERGRSSVWDTPLIITTLSVGLFLSLAYISWGSSFPIVSDEIGYLTIARYLAIGDTITLSIMPSYRFGQALLYAPFIAAGVSDAKLYQIGVLLNCAQAAAIPALLIATSRFLSIPRSLAVVAASFTVAFLPAYTYQLTILWPETSLRFAAVALVLCVAAGWQRKSSFWWYLSGALVVWMFALHGRGTVAAVCFAPLLVAGVRRGKIGVVHSVMVAALTAVGLFVAWKFNSGLQLELWGRTGGEASFIKSNLTRPDGLSGVRTTLFGQLWMQIASSYGLVLIGICVALQMTFKDKLVRFPAVAFAGLMLGASVVLSALQLGGMDRVDHLVYSRYNDAFAAVFVWFGLVAVLQRSTPFPKLGIAIAVATMGFGYLAYSGIGAAISGMVSPNIPALLWTGLLVPIQTITPWALIFLGSSLGVAVGMFLCLNPGRYAFVALVAVLFFTVSYTQRQAWLAHNARSHVVNINAPIFRETRGPIYWDLSVISDLNIMFDQYAAGKAFPLSDLNARPIPGDHTVIVSLTFDAAGYRCVARLQYAAKLVIRDGLPPAC